VINLAREKNPGVEFNVADAWETHLVLSLAPNLNAIYLDIGGLSGCDGTYDALSLIRQLTAVYAPTLRFIVIKSKCMRDHANTWVNSWDKKVASLKGQAQTPQKRTK
jgi:hypothetical protein